MQGLVTEKKAADLFLEETQQLLLLLISVRHRKRSTAVCLLIVGSFYEQ